MQKYPSERQRREMPPVMLSVIPWNHGKWFLRLFKNSRLRVLHLLTRADHVSHQEKKKRHQQKKEDRTMATMKMNHKNNIQKILLNDIWSLSAFVLAWLVTKTKPPDNSFKGRARSTQQWSYSGPRYIYTLYTPIKIII